jgi:hypothetical protein
MDTTSGPRLDDLLPHRKGVLLATIDVSRDR